MIKGLSKREKVLLVVLAIVLSLVAIGNFLLMPQIDKYNQLNKEIPELENQKWKMEEVISKSTITDVMYKNISEKITERVESFAIPMNNEEIDKMLTAKYQKYAMKIQSLRVSEQIAMVLENYVPVATDVTYPIREMIEKSGIQSVGQNETEAEAENPNPQQSAQGGTALVATVSIQATGKNDNIIKLINDIDLQKGIRLTNFSTAINNDGEIVFNSTIEVDMVERIG